MGIFYLAGMFQGMFQDIDCHLHFCDSFLQGWKRRHQEKCSTSPVCPGIQNREQKLIPTVCLTYWTILPFLRRHRYKSISTSNAWSLCYHFMFLYFICCVFPVFPGCKVSGTGNVKTLFSNYWRSPLSVGLWGTTRVNINIHISMVKYCPVTIRSPSKF